MLIQTTAVVSVRLISLIFSGLVLLPLSGDPFAEATEGIYGIYSSVKALLEVVLVIAAVVTLARVTIKLMDGNKEAAQNRAWWLFGLVIGFLMLEVISALAK